MRDSEADLELLEHAAANVYGMNQDRKSRSATAPTGRRDTGHVYTAAAIKVVSFEDSVRKRTGMYFAVAPDRPGLPTRIVRTVIDDALHPVGTRVTFQLDPGFFAPSAAIAAESRQLQPPALVVRNALGPRGPRP